MADAEKNDAYDSTRGGGEGEETKDASVGGDPVQGAASEYGENDEAEEEESLWAPGLVEVQLQDGLRPEVVTEPGGAALKFRSAAEGAWLDELNQLLAETGCNRAVRAYDVSDEDMAETYELAAEQDVEMPDLRGFYLLYFPEGTDVFEVAERLRNVRGVVHAAAVPVTRPACTGNAVVPNDLLLRPNNVLKNHQWYIFRCRVERAWACGCTGKGVIIADIDWGFVIDHPDLKSRLNLSHAFNAVDGTNSVSKGRRLAHGTAVLGLAGAAADSQGIVGIAHDAELWPIQVGVNASKDPTSWSKAIFHVLKEPGDGRRKVILLEGQSGQDRNITQIQIIRGAVLYAIAHGAVVCVPAGNNGVEVTLADDGKSRFVPVGITVGATDRHDQPWVGFQEGTNFGPEVVVAAPGDPTDDLTCSPNVSNNPSVAYRVDFGATSGATAKVAAAVALMLQANGRLRHVDVEKILRSTGTPVTSKPLGNLLDCEAAVRAAKNFHPNTP